MQIAGKQVEHVEDLPEDFSHRPTLTWLISNIESALEEYWGVVNTVPAEHRADYIHIFKEDVARAEAALEKAKRLLKENT